VTGELLAIGSGVLGLGAVAAACFGCYRWGHADARRQHAERRAEAFRRLQALQRPVRPEPSEAPTLDDSPIGQAEAEALRDRARKK
jgi:hypothetical protein